MEYVVFRFLDATGISSMLFRIESSVGKES